MAGHVFISHGSENSDEANELCTFIELSGVKAWIAPRDVRPGIDYSEALQDAIENCAAFVVLVTEMANKSPYVRAETEMAFSCHKPIFPVRMSDIKPAAGLALFLKIRHWTDAYGKGRQANLDRLMLELQTACGLAPPTPPAPVRAPSPPSKAAAPPLPAPAAPAPPPESDRPHPPPARSGLSRTMVFGLIGAALLVVVVVAVLLLLRRNALPPDSPTAPAPAPSASAGGTPADNPRSGAAPAGIDRSLLVGRWSDTGSCADAVDFTADGRAVAASGETATWELNGDRLVLTGSDGRERTIRITSIDENAAYGINADGSVEASQRC